MISKNTLRLVFLSLIVGLSIFYWMKSRPAPVADNVSSPALPAPIPLPEPKVIGDETIAPAPLKKGSRAFYGALPEGVKDIESMPMANKPSKDWIKRLRAHLTRHSGDRLKSVDLDPQESYIIPDAGGGRYVERVIVKVKGKKGESTTFFAEVDSESGYVLKSWGATIQEKRRHSH